MSANSSKTPAIYMFKNMINGKVYIGSTKDVGKRFKQWINTVDRIEKDAPLDHTNQLAYDIAKYGWDSFDYKILDASPEMHDPFTRSIREVEYIMKYRAVNPKYGYNATIGGESGSNKHRKEVVNRKTKSLFLYDTKEDYVSLFLKGTKTLHEYLQVRKDLIPDAARRGYLVKGRYFIFHANSEQRRMLAEYVKENKSNIKVNGGNLNVSNSHYEMYKKALKRVNEYAEELGLD